MDLNKHIFLYLFLDCHNVFRERGSELWSRHRKPGVSAPSKVSFNPKFDLFNKCSGLLLHKQIVSCSLWAAGNRIRISALCVRHSVLPFRPNLIGKVWISWQDLFPPHRSKPVPFFCPRASRVSHKFRFQTFRNSKRNLVK